MIRGRMTYKDCKDCPYFGIEKGGKRKTICLQENEGWKINTIIWCKEFEERGAK